MRVNANALLSALSSDLSKFIDPQCSSWGPDSDDVQVACYALKSSLLKKFTANGRPSHEACARARDLFESMNKRCRDWVIPYEFSIDEQLIGGIKAALHDFWFCPEPCVTSFNQLFIKGWTGKGMSLLSRGEDLYTKLFDSPLTATGDLHYVWERVSSVHPLWAEASRLRQRRYPQRVVESSNYSFVNKTTTIARGTCTEPTVNMWFQLGMGACIDERLGKVFNYQNDTQPFWNRVMARRGSIDGSVCTIDLKSASDLNALHILEEVCPRDMVTWLKLLRCGRTTFPTGESAVLNMVSTMGNGYTFSLMTLLFYSVVKSAYTIAGIPMNDGRSDMAGVTNPYCVSRNFSVFGDDIIVDRRAVRLVLRGLTLLGHIPNPDKTFVEGPFRESCGADYVNGVNVRGVYIKSLNTVQDVCVAINTLNRWSARTLVPLPETISVLANGTGRPLRKLFVPPDEDDAAGIHVPECMLDPDHRMFSKDRGSHVTLRAYSAFVPVEQTITLNEDSLTVSTEEAEPRNYNPTGLMIAVSAGYARGGHFTLRQRTVAYRTRRRLTPGWGVLLPRPLEYPLGCDEGRRFVYACDRNLSVPVLERGG